MYVRVLIFLYVIRDNNANAGAMKIRTPKINSDDRIQHITKITRYTVRIWLHTWQYNNVYVLTVLILHMVICAVD